MCVGEEAMIIYLFLVIAWFGVGTLYNIYKFCIKSHRGVKGIIDWLKESFDLF